MTDRETELRLLCERAAEQETRRQDAIARGDRQAVVEAEIELSRIWSRYCDLERQVA